MNEKQLLRKINNKFPLNSSEIWDYPGYQTGKKNPGKNITSVLLCLDFTEEVLEHAKETKPDLILTHHPFFFGKKKYVLETDAKKIYIVEEIEKLNCPIYSYHTCFDKGQDGMNDTLLEILGINKTGVYKDGLMRLGNLPYEMTIEELVSYLKDKLSLPYLLYLKGSKKKISKVSMIAGGGASDYFDSLSMGADCYISGDCSHHTRLEMHRYGVNYIEMPHEVEEIGFLKGMSKLLKTIDSSLNVDCFAFEEYYKLG